MRLAYLGPSGTFTHRAALLVGTDELVPLRSIRAVFEAVVSGDCEAGVVPAENAVEGTVSETLDLLLEGRARVRGEVVLAIEHSLVGVEGRVVKRVYSHPQALAQCSAWLDAHLPDAERIECLSTGEAAAMAAGDEESAAIAPARRAGLDVLETGLGPAGNRTRFWIVAGEGAPPTGRDRTLIGFGAPHRPGALHACLGVFAQSGINLWRIESRPSRDEAWTYHFAAELEGHADSPLVAGALAELRSVAPWLRVLGTWPAP